MRCADHRLRLSDFRSRLRECGISGLRLREFALVLLAGGRARVGQLLLPNDFRLPVVRVRLCALHPGLGIGNGVLGGLCLGLNVCYGLLGRPFLCLGLVECGLMVQVMVEQGHARADLCLPRLGISLSGFSIHFRRVQLSHDLASAYSISGIHRDRDDRPDDARCNVLLIVGPHRPGVGHGILQRAVPHGGKGDRGCAGGRTHGRHIHRLRGQHIELSGFVVVTDGPIRADDGGGDYDKFASSFGRSEFFTVEQLL